MDILAPVEAVGRDLVDGHFHPKPASVFRDHAGLVADRGAAALHPLGQICGEGLTLFRRRKIDQRWQSTQLFGRVAGQLHVGFVARDIPAVFGDEQAFAQIADRPEQRSLAVDLHAEVLIDGAAGEICKEAGAEQDQGPDRYGPKRNHERRDGVDPQGGETRDSDDKEVGEPSRVEAELEMKKDGRESGGCQRGQVIAQPRPRDPQNKDRENGGDQHQRRWR